VVCKVLVILFHTTIAFVQNRYLLSGKTVQQIGDTTLGGSLLEAYVCLRNSV